MRSFSGEPNTQTADHLARTEELSRKQALRLRVSAESLLELCADFDAAAECAALEGVSVSEALREFVSESGRSQYPEIGTPASYGRLPVDPRTVARLLRTKTEEVSTGELEDIAGSDPVLAGKLLGTANSALFASCYQITRLRESILRLGVPELRKTNLSVTSGGIIGFHHQLPIQIKLAPHCQ